MTWTRLRVVGNFMGRNPLTIAFGFSLAVHMALFGGWQMGKHFGWWEHQATWLLDLKKKLRPQTLQAVPEMANAARAQQQIPLTFVEVDPAAAIPEPPKETKYYGAQNTRAANPDLLVDSSVPKADRTQNKLVRLENVPKPSPQPLQPAPPQPEKPPEPVEPKPKGGEHLGDLAKAKPQEVKKPDDGHADTHAGQAPVIAHERPRTLAKAREQKAALAGEKMQREGGITERGKYMLDVAKTPFGSY